ncbi:hypothetical protein JOD01_003494 [Brevibacillus fulvus]|uniref:Uncharacterized protein n=1 Tax=Brevibacillus fulvus TaxID=1125967 RepID=A0A939BTH7_9BACL|nr:hypothetical protein [Brevibacillus fulvus]
MTDVPASLQKHRSCRMTKEMRMNTDRDFGLVRVLLQPMTELSVPQSLPVIREEHVLRVEIFVFAK